MSMTDKRDSFDNCNRKLHCCWLRDAICMHNISLNCITKISAEDKNEVGVKSIWLLPRALDPQPIQTYSFGTSFNNESELWECCVVPVLYDIPPLVAICTHVHIVFAHTHTNTHTEELHLEPQ